MMCLLRGRRRGEERILTELTNPYFIASILTNLYYTKAQCLSSLLFVLASYLELYNTAVNEYLYLIAIRLSRTRNPCPCSLDEFETTGFSKYIDERFLSTLKVKIH